MLDQEAIAQLIKSFHLTITYLRIYPPTSQMVVATLDTFSKTVLTLLEKNTTLTFSELAGKLLIDGKEAENREIQLIGNNILKLFSQKKVQSITFRQGITREEITEFLTSILRKKREEITEFPHVAFDQTVYVAMVKGEEAVVKISEMVQNSGGEIVGLIKTIRESYDLIDQIPEPASRFQAQTRLATELAKQDASVLRDIFERDLPPKIEESGLKQQLMNALSQDKIKDIFGEISTWYEEIRKKESSDFAAVDQLEKFKKFVQTVLHAPAAKDIPRQFFEEMLRKGLLEQLPEWFSAAPAKPTTVFEVERLLEKDPSQLLEKETMDSLPQLVEKLCQIENNELLGKLTEKLLGNLSSSVPKLRLMTMQGIMPIYDILKAHGKEQLLRYMELPLLETARQETSPDVHIMLADILRQRARQNLLHGEYDFAVRIIDLLRQHTSDEIIPDAKIRTDTANALSKLIPEIMEILVTDLKSDNEAKRLGSLQILAKFGDKAIDPLVRVIKESDDIRPRRMATLALKNIGDSAVRRFREELNLGLIPAEIIRVIEAVGELGAGETIEHLSGLLRYPDAQVKRELMKMLGRLNTNQSRLLLVEQLKDADCTVVSDAIRLLSELKASEAVDGLIALLDKRNCNAAVQEEVCIALGAIGYPKAIPALIAKLNKKPSWFSRNTTELERIRMRAAWSLRKFTGPEVEQALERASKKPGDPVALTAKESLSLIRK